MIEFGFQIVLDNLNDLNFVKIFKTGFSERYEVLRLNFKNKTKISVDLFGFYKTDTISNF